MKQMSLNSAIMSFAFSGILAPHRVGYDGGDSVLSPDEIVSRAGAGGRTAADAKRRRNTNPRTV